ncbi:hypothetical protein C7S18_12015 [Ahniella affigens]|uniref:Uncharacterized protein n=1 Tax=Ahniella affigens TaxID=2021234 RepID=A0A2P1PSP5_9GAMM|nr:hypothetical protein [Ahniella affigens]AVP97877.1 hypothetical protein C7S18_12015 [Ahniella affigens]
MSNHSNGFSQLNILEMFWVLLPIALVVSGGVLGGECDSAAVMFNVRIFNGTGTTLYKFLASSFVIVGAIVSYVVPASVLVGFVPGLAPKP